MVVLLVWNSFLLPWITHTDNNVDIVETILCALLVHKVFTFVKLWGKNLPSLL